MRPGVGYPSFTTQAVWTAPGGGWDASYPVTNLSDAIYLSHVARAAASGYVACQFSLPAAQPIQLVALANHALDVSAIFRLRLYASADGSGTALVDTGSTAVWPTGGPIYGPDGVTALYRWTRPIVLSTPIVARSGLLELQTSGVKAELGAVEIAAWAEWPGISFGRELGIDSREPRIELPGGSSKTHAEFAPRQINGQIDYLALGAPTNAWLDFQQATGLNVPFCFVHDADDPATWPRMCLMATNTQLPPLVGAAYRHDRAAFRFNEHLR